MSIGPVRPWPGPGHEAIVRASPTGGGSLDTHTLGRRFEAVAAAHLEATGWTVLERNVRHRRREIDLVIRRGAIVAFVEVKGRSGEARGHPLEAITGAKRREIESVARWWVARHGRADDVYRFDAVAVRGSAAANGRCDVEHVEGAWRTGE